MNRKMIGFELSYSWNSEISNFRADLGGYPYNQFRRLETRPDGVEEYVLQHEETKGAFKKNLWA